MGEDPADVKIDPVEKLRCAPYLLEEIFSYLLYPELEDCRVVSHQWLEYLDLFFLKSKGMKARIRNRDHSRLWSMPERMPVLKEEILGGEKKKELPFNCILFKSTARVLVPILFFLIYLIYLSLLSKCHLKETSRLS